MNDSAPSLRRQALHALLQDGAQAGGIRVRVRGDCLDGCAADGDVLQVRKRPRYWPGDIVVFPRGDGQLVSHRLLGYLPGRCGWRILTRADHGGTAAGRLDHPARLDDVVGRAEHVNEAAYRPSLRRRLGCAAAWAPALGYWTVRRLRRSGR